VTTETESRVVDTHRYAASSEEVFDAFLNVQTARYEGWTRILAGLLPAYGGVHAAGWLAVGR
jgi:hypothetical protein